MTQTDPRIIRPDPNAVNLNRPNNRENTSSRSSTNYQAAFLSTWSSHWQRHLSSHSPSHIMLNHMITADGESACIHLGIKHIDTQTWDQTQLNETEYNLDLKWHGSQLWGTEWTREDLDFIFHISSGMMCETTTSLALIYFPLTWTVCQMPFKSTPPFLWSSATYFTHWLTSHHIYMHSVLWFVIKAKVLVHTVHT